MGREEQAHERGECRREQVGELWVLQAELSYALDDCPNCTDGQADRAAGALIPTTALPATAM